MDAAYLKTSTIWLLLLLVILTYLVYVTVIKPLGYWKVRHVPHRKPWPVLGSLLPFAFGKKAAVEMFQQLYDEFPNERYIGTHMFVRPALLIRDPELIKQLAIKDFDYFTDHVFFRGIAELDPILSKSLLMLRGQKWRGMRATLNPCFSTTNIKFMFTLISECAKNYTTFFQEQDCDVIEIEAKDIFSRFAVDVLATSTFGVKVDSLNNKDNDFFVMGTKVSTLEGLRALRLIMHSTFPMLMKFFGIPAVPRKYTNYFEQVLKDVIRTREATGIMRSDMIHIFLERRKIELWNETDSTKDLSDASLTAHATTFLIAAFANISNTLCFLSYELAVNPDVQKRLQKEIDGTLKQCKENITYEALFEMKYMDMVVSELLRVWPLGVALDRTCVKDYVIAPKSLHEQALLVEKGTPVLFCIGAILHDPKYFPNPRKFDPERFNDENKHKIKSFTNIPFGDGPRSCIAKRFALMKIKLLVFHLLSRFDIVRTEKTSVPIVQTKFKLNMGAEGGIWVGLRQRNSMQYHK